MQLRNKERCKITDKIYYDNNRDKILDNKKKFNLENKEKLKIRRSLYYTKNKHKIRIKQHENYISKRNPNIKPRIYWDKNSIEYKNYKKNTSNNSYLKRVYGISLDEYNSMYEKQNGVCIICKQKDILGCKLAVDHCHVSKKIRGLLCGKCNRGIGNFNDNINLLQNAIEYIKQFEVSR